MEGERSSGPAGGKVGSDVEACAVPPDGRWRVVVRIVPGGGDALARARRVIVDRYWDQITAECDGGDERCGP